MCVVLLLSKLEKLCVFFDASHIVVVVSQAASERVVSRHELVELKRANVRIKTRFLLLKRN